MLKSVKIPAVVVEEDVMVEAEEEGEKEETPKDDVEVLTQVIDREVGLKVEDVSVQIQKEQEENADGKDNRLLSELSLFNHC